jgi:ketosteroid isomerase-like protein
MRVTLSYATMTRIVLVVLLLAISYRAEAQTPADSAASARSIRAALASWVDAANREDWKAAARVWAPDLIGWYPGQPDDTFAKEMESAAHPRPGRPSTHYEVNVVEVMVSGSMAVVRDIWRFTIAPGTPDSAVSVVRSYEVWKRQPDGEWRIARWISAPEPSTKP